MIAPDFGFGPLEAQLWALVFAMTRIGAALLAAPLFGAGTVPVQVRVIITAALAAFVCVWHPLPTPPALLSVAGMLIVAQVGLALGFTLQLAFAAPVIAAEVIGGAMGLSIASTVDPMTGAQSPALGQYFMVILVLVFLGLGGHLTFIRLVIDSYSAMPPGAGWFGAESSAQVVSFAGAMLLAAVAIALPVTLVLLVVQLVTGVLSRSAPALNLFALGLPAGVLAGLAALIAAAPLNADQFATLSTQGLEQAASLLR
jgi:flagellar biosynthesis protein FliR